MTVTIKSELKDQDDFSFEVKANTVNGVVKSIKKKSKEINEYFQWVILGAPILVAENGKLKMKGKYSFDCFSAKGNIELRETI